MISGSGGWALTCEEGGIYVKTLVTMYILLMEEILHHLKSLKS